MTIQLTKDTYVAGVLSSAGSQHTLDAQTESYLVHIGAATWVDAAYTQGRFEDAKIEYDSDGVAVGVVGRANEVVGPAWATDNLGNVSGLAWPDGNHLAELNIAIFGDSYFNGPAPYATDDGSNVFGIDGFATPLDRMWTGTADAEYFKANSSIASVTGSNDSGIGLGANVGSDAILIPRMLRLGFPLRCGVIRIANFGIGGASSYTWAGEQAFVFTKAVANANDGDTVIVGGVTYTFRTSVSVAYDVLIGASANESNRNLAYAINGEGGTAGVNYGTGTAVNTNVFCQSASSTQYLKISAKATGTAGNAITATSSTAARIAIAQQGTLAAQLSETMVNGSATSAVYANAKASLAGGSGMIPNIIIVALGTNDALRNGYRSVGFQSEMQKIIDNIHADYPNAKVILWKPISASGAGTITTIVNPAVDDFVTNNPSFVSAVNMYAQGAGTGNVIIRRSDGIHLTYYGSNVKCQLFARAIASAIGWI